ncbi:hypothetical protein DYH09_09120 [bacterium CPR1]|nr:hypothetical protein [bacterium CPR1]
MDREEEQLVQLASISGEIFKNPRIKKDATRLPNDQLAIVNRLKNQCELLKGTDLMWKSPGQSRQASKAISRPRQPSMRGTQAIQMDATRKSEELGARRPAGIGGEGEPI